MPWTIAVLALAAAITVWLLSKRVGDVPVMRLVANAGVTGALATDFGPAAVLSPDGGLLVLMAAMPGERSRMFLRPLTDLQARAMDAPRQGHAIHFSLRTANGLRFSPPGS